MRAYSAIRELARRHAAGELGQEDYRSQRHALIDAIISGEKKLVYVESKPPRPPRAISLRWLSLGIAVGAILIIIVAAGIWFIGHPTRSVKPTLSAAPSSAALHSPGPQLVDDFLQGNHWDSAHIQDFIQQWNALPANERHLAKQSFRYPRLVSELRQQIVAQQAMTELSQTNGDPAHVALVNLQTMASVLGVNTGD